MIPATPQEAAQLQNGFKKFLAQAALTNGSGNLTLPTTFPNDGNDVPPECILVLQPSVDCNYDLVEALSQSATVAAKSTITISSGSGLITATIGGFSASVTWGSSDNATATALAAAMNLIPGIAALGTAAPSTNTVVFTSALPGARGNGIPTAVTGTGASIDHAATSGGVDLNPGVLVQAKQQEYVTKLPGQTKIYFSAGASGTLNIFVSTI